jgi:hypothetical protein
MIGKNRIMIYGPKHDGTYVIEFMAANGETLAITVPAGETRVLKHFQERMPYGLFCAGCSVRNNSPRQGVSGNGALTLKPAPVGVPETPPLGRTSGRGSRVSVAPCIPSTSPKS